MSSFGNNDINGSLTKQLLKLGPLMSNWLPQTTILWKSITHPCSGKTTITVDMIILFLKINRGPGYLETIAQNVLFISNVKTVSWNTIYCMINSWCPVCDACMVKGWYTYNSNLVMLGWHKNIYFAEVHVKWLSQLFSIDISSFSFLSQLSEYIHCAIFFAMMTLVTRSYLIKAAMISFQTFSQWQCVFHRENFVAIG